MLDPFSNVPVFAPVTDDELREFTARCPTEEITLASGDRLPDQDLIDNLFILLEGTLAATRRADGEEVTIATRTGDGPRGELPLVIATPQVSRVRAVHPTRLLKTAADSYLEGIASYSPANRVIVSGLVWRVQNAEALLRNREKLAALGKLAAGLAHDLNNPAAANGRAASQLRGTIGKLQELALRLHQTPLTPSQATRLTTLQGDALEHSSGASQLNPLEQSDREEALTEWLENHDIPEAWIPAHAFVAAGLDIPWLEGLEREFGSASLEVVIAWLGGTLAAGRLLDQIEQSTARISELVAAIKRYAYMDQAPLQEIDVHEGIEGTLTVLSHKLKDVRVIREYDQGLPRITAYAGELNQVWTNLIDNAVDALKENDQIGPEAGEIRIRTSRRDNQVVVEVVDNGPGIKPENQPRIFEPFFTTKGNGVGMGLGLDISYRIVVERNGGQISFTSRPGETCFQVRLPVERRVEKQ